MGSNPIRATKFSLAVCVAAICGVAGVLVLQLAFHINGRGFDSRLPYQVSPLLEKDPSQCSGVGLLFGPAEPVSVYCGHG